MHQVSLPDALPLARAIRQARARSGRLLVGLDFDGTLAPIVPDPADAGLTDTMHSVLTLLAARTDTTLAFVSGRSIADLRRRVTFETAWYAGNHGMEVDGPDGTRFVHPEAVAQRGAVAALIAELRARIAGMDGVTLEDKGLTMSVHFRTIADDDAAGRVRDIVHASGVPWPELRMTDGKRVVEVRPDVDWHKGRAFEMLRALQQPTGPRIPALFLGDDRTDEDAFRTLGGDDLAIHVGDTPPGTAARARLDSIDAVALFLERLAQP